MDIDLQINKTLQKFTEHIQILTDERNGLDHQKNELTIQAKHEEAKKNAAIQAYTECNKAITVQTERKNKLNIVLESINEEIKANEAKLNKQKTTMAKYEQTYNEKFNDMKASCTRAAEETNYKFNQEKEKLQKLTNENTQLKNALNEEEMLIEKLQHRVNAINEKELSRSAIMNSFIKQLVDTWYTHY